MSIIFTSLIVGTMCVSPIGNMDTPNVEITKLESHMTYIENTQDINCDCGENTLLERTHGDWEALYRTSCQRGRGFCTDEVRSRTVKETWTCTSCDKREINQYEEIQQVCLGRL